MVAPVTVSEKDLRTLLGIVSDSRTDLPAEGGLALSLLADLVGQIRCDAVSFEGLDSNLRTEWFWQGIPDWDDDDGDLDHVHWEHYWDCQPCSYADRSGDLRKGTGGSGSLISSHGLPGSRPLLEGFAGSLEG
jgi:hypothetical protein